jgi:hypothetical protein
MLLTLGADGVVLDSDEAPPNAVKARDSLSLRACYLSVIQSGTHGLCRWPVGMSHNQRSNSIHKVCDPFRFFFHECKERGGISP